MRAVATPASRRREARAHPRDSGDGPPMDVSDEKNVHERPVAAEGGYRTTQALASPGSLPSATSALARRTSPSGSSVGRAPKLVTHVSVRPSAQGRS